MLVVAASVDALAIPVRAGASSSAPSLYALSSCARARPVSVSVVGVVKEPVMTESYRVYWVVTPRWVRGIRYLCENVLCWTQQFERHVDLPPVERSYRQTKETE